MRKTVLLILVGSLIASTAQAVQIIQLPQSAQARNAEAFGRAMGQLSVALARSAERRAIERRERQELDYYKNHILYCKELIQGFDVEYYDDFIRCINSSSLREFDKTMMKHVFHQIKFYGATKKDSFDYIRDNFNKFN